MSFVPVVPLDGYTGWRFLQKTLPTQTSAHQRSAAIQRDAAYFRENIADVRSAADLVADRRLLGTALTAFGLEADLPNRAFIRQVLDSNTLDSTSFANRLADKRYLKLAKAFGFADFGGPQTQAPGFADRVIGRFHDRSFEQAVGTQQPSMRVALALQRDLAEIAAQPGTDDARWFLVLGTPNIRAVFETAFQLPKSFGTLDLDRQVDILRGRTERLTGDGEIAQFTDPDRLQALTQRFFLSEQIASIQAASGGSIALGMLETVSAFMRAQRER